MSRDPRNPAIPCRSQLFLEWNLCEARPVSTLLQWSLGRARGLVLGPPFLSRGDSLGALFGTLIGICEG